MPNNVTEFGRLQQFGPVKGYGKRAGKQDPIARLLAMKKQREQEALAALPDALVYSPVLTSAGPTSSNPQIISMAGSGVPTRNDAGDLLVGFDPNRVPPKYRDVLQQMLQKQQLEQQYASIGSPR